MSNIYRCGNCGGCTFELFEEHDSIEVSCTCGMRCLITVSPACISIDWFQDSPGILVSKAWGKDES